MKRNRLNRRQFIRLSADAAVAAPLALGLSGLSAKASDPPKPIVSIVKIKDENIGTAVEAAIDLLGGIEEVTRGKTRILLKPNLVAESARYTTNPEVVRALARLMQGAGKEVLIGEGSASSATMTAATRCEDLLQNLQQTIFDRLGYTALASEMGIPLVNLHCGELVTVPVPDGLYWREIVLHRVLREIDLLCSVAMMKTHSYATVTLGLKNVIGLYPGAVYGSYRWWVHDNAYAGRSPGVAFEILDMARVNRMGLTVIDASTAMEGQGPTEGTLVSMNLILAGTNPLATDLVAASVMGFQPAEVPTFVWAQKVGLTPATLEEIEVRGEPIASVTRKFIRPNLIHPGGGGWDIDPAPQPRIELTPEGKGVVTWSEAISKPVIRLDTEGKAAMSWTDVPQSGRAILEKRVVSDSGPWTPVTPASPGRHEFDLSEAGAMLFRLRRP